MKLVFTIGLWLIVCIFIGALISLAFPEPLSLVLSAVLGFLYGWFVLYPMIIWSFEE